jgi:hypothetical protein
MRAKFRHYNQEETTLVTTRLVSITEEKRRMKAYTYYIHYKYGMLRVLQRLQTNITPKWSLNKSYKRSYNVEFTYRCSLL